MSLFVAVHSCLLAVFAAVAADASSPERFVR